MCWWCERKRNQDACCQVVVRAVGGRTDGGRALVLVCGSSTWDLE